MNSVTLSGRIRSEIRVTYTQTGKPRASWILEVPRCRGQRARDYLPCIAWGTSAEQLRDFGSIDTRLELTGEIQSYKKQNGQWDISIVAEVVSFPDRVERRIEAEKEAKK